MLEEYRPIQVPGYIELFLVRVVEVLPSQLVEHNDSESDSEDDDESYTSVEADVEPRRVLIAVEAISMVLPVEVRSRSLKIKDSQVPHCQINLFDGAELYVFESYHDVLTLMNEAIESQRNRSGKRSKSVKNESIQETK